MKQFYSLAIALCLSTVSATAQTDAIGKLSMETRKVLTENGFLSQKTSGNFFVGKLKKVSTEKKPRYISGFIEVTTPETWDLLTAEGVTLRTIAGNVATATIPIDKVMQVAEITTVKSIAIGRKMKPVMETSRKLMNVGDTYQQTATHLPITGKGVIVGVVDGGIDLSHPNFYSADGSEYRIKHFAQQTLIDSATGQFTTEYYNTQDDIQSLCADKYAYSFMLNGHGTHVLGIAAGSGHTAPQYQGLAPESDIIAVSLAYADDGDVKDDAIVDGVKYIFDKAAEMQKPCVVNISLGSNASIDYKIDGTDYMDVMLDNLVANTNDGQSKPIPGRVIVAGAGNEGDALKHFYTKNAGDKLNIGIHVDTSADANEEPEKEYIIADGVTDELTVKANLMRVYTEDDDTFYVQQRYPVKTISFNSSANEDGDIIDTLHQELDWGTIDCTIQLVSDAFNGRSGISLQLRSAVTDNTASADDGNGLYYIELEATSKDTNLHFWTYDESALAKEGDEYVDYYDYSSSISCPASANNIIGVASYTIANEYPLADGSTVSDPEEPGDRSEFSSQGPTLDGRVKPDITAPGTFIRSSYNSVLYNYAVDIINNKVQEADPDTQDAAKRQVKYTYTTTTFNDKEYAWGYMDGTSMASPAMAGTVALWLQANPDLTFEDILTVLDETAIRDKDMEYPNNLYGRGKVDVSAGLAYILKNMPSTGIYDAFDDSIYGNNITISAANDEAIVEWSVEAPESFTIYVYNTQGQTIATKTIRTGGALRHNIELPHTKGVKIVKVVSELQSKTIKI